MRRQPLHHQRPRLRGRPQSGPDHGHGTAHLVVRNGGALTLIGNLLTMMTMLGDKANGSLEITRGRVRWDSGRIQEPGSMKDDYDDDGWRGSRHRPARRLEFVIRYGLGASKTDGQRFHPHLRRRASREGTGPLRPYPFGGQRVLLLGSTTSQPSADVMAGEGINFRGDGGAPVIRVPHPEKALTRTREAEHVFDELLRRGKLYHDSEPMTNFQGFHMREFYRA